MRVHCYRLWCRRVAALGIVVLLGSSYGTTADQSHKIQGASPRIPIGTAVLWRDPGDIASRDLFYGAGGPKDLPQPPFAFLREDLDGQSPKIDVRDRNGVEWTVKLGAEARPETAATRLLWAVGYFADIEYFQSQIRIDDMMVPLHRGQDLVAPDGTLPNARLKRHANKTGTWAWADNPFVGTRGFNGLRVMMALMNNWDLKDTNTAIHDVKSSSGADGAQQIYLVSDLGASFGTSGRVRGSYISKGNLDSYAQSTFIYRVTPEYVDFVAPDRPALVLAVALPEYIQRTRMQWIGEHIPRADVRWIAGLLAQLTPEQIRSAFRAAGFEDHVVEGFTKVVLSRIAELKNL